MERFQTRVLYLINKRESGSLRNGVTVLNSYQTGNNFSSVIKIDGQEIATVYYMADINDRYYNIHGGKYNPDQSIDDMIKNDKWEVEEISFNGRAIDRCLGTNAKRYQNFLTKHYVELGARINVDFAIPQ